MAGQDKASRDATAQPQPPAPSSKEEPIDFERALREEMKHVLGDGSRWVGEDGNFTRWGVPSREAS